MKEFVKGLSDKASNYLDTKGLANPVEVINEELGGETREESKARRAKNNPIAAEATPGPRGFKMDMDSPKSREQQKADSMRGMKAGGKVGSASSRADGCAVRGKTKGTIVMCGGGYMKGKK